jgi:hypothetical protein
MLLQRFAIAAGFALICGAATAADEPVATASPSTDAKIAAWIKDAPPADAAQDESGPEEAPPPEPDRRIHGEVGAAIGTGGYRSAYGIFNIPIGKSGEATVAIATGRGRGVFGGSFIAAPGLVARPLGVSRRPEACSPEGEAAAPSDASSPACPVR